MHIPVKMTDNNCSIEHGGFSFPVLITAFKAGSKNNVQVRAQTAASRRLLSPTCVCHMLALTSSLRWLFQHHWLKSNAAALTDVSTVTAQEQAQQQMETVLDDIAQIKEDQENMAVETGVSEGISGVEMWNRIVRLEEDAVYFEEVTGRLEKYVEEMLRTMLGDLDRGRLLTC